MAEPPATQLMKRPRRRAGGARCDWWRTVSGYLKPSHRTAKIPIMSEPQAQQILKAARQSLALPFDFDAFLAALVPKDRLSAERRVSVLKASNAPDGADVWMRLASTLMKLSAH